MVFGGADPAWEYLGSLGELRHPLGGNENTKGRLFKDAPAAGSGRWREEYSLVRRGHCPTLLLSPAFLPLRTTVFGEITCVSS